MAMAMSPSGREGDADLASLSEYLALVAHPAAILRIDHYEGSRGSQGLEQDRKATVLYANDAFPSLEEQTVISSILANPISAGGKICHSATLDTKSREWTIRRLRNDTIWVIESVGLTHTSLARNAQPHPGQKSSSIDSQCEIASLLLPTPQNPTPFPGLSSDLTNLPKAALEHNALFLSLPWANSSLGPMESWSAQLRGTVQVMMASPFPVLLSWGPEYVLLYNEPYSKVIGVKHPSILGMKYDEAWPEVWGALDPVVRASYQGQVINVECQEMFLLRGEKLEETYFSYSMIPIRDDTSTTCGLYIPNFDNSVRMITERRIRSLHEISQTVNRSLNQERLIQNALEAMKTSNSRDLNFALFYSVDGVTGTQWHSQNSTGTGGGSNSDRRSASVTRGYKSSRTRNFTEMTPSASSDAGDSSRDAESRIVFRLAGHYGIGDNATEEAIPIEISSGPEEDDLSERAQEFSIERYIRQARETDSAVHIADLNRVSTLAKHIVENPFGDPPGAAIVLPIRSSTEDRLHGIMILGLNTRLTWDKAYSDYVHLVRGQLATGLATLKLHEEDLSRARYMAALNRQKNEELQTLLEYKTKELKTSELKFRSAFAACPAAIWIANPEGKISDMNRAYFQMSGQGVHQPLDDWITRVHPDDLEYVKSMFDACKTKHVECEFRFLTSTEETSDEVTERWVEASGGPVWDETGAIVMLSGALLDITIRRQHLMSQTRRAEEALELKNLQDHFIDMLSHELRNPLSAICLSSDGVVESLRMMETRCSPDMVAELQDIVNDTGVIKLCTVHMRRLVDDVLALSKLDNNILHVTPTPSQPESFCREVIEIFQTEMLANDIICKFVIKQGYRDLAINWVEVDHSRVTQILINLIANAIKFTTFSDHRQITITLDASTERPNLPGGQLSRPGSPMDVEQGDNVASLIFEVIDTGMGMDEAEITRLFKRFAQGSDRTHLTYGGSGLGLYICRRITLLLGGDISVASQRGVGSTFAFFIPVHIDTSSASSKRPSASTMSLKLPMSGFRAPQTVPLTTFPVDPSPSLLMSYSKSSDSPDVEMGLDAHSTEDIFVLVVEDNEISQKLLKKQLLRSGCKVATANDGIEAVDYMKNSVKNINGPRHDNSFPPKVDVILMDVEMPRKGGLEATQEIRALERDQTSLSSTPIIALSANAREGQIQSMLQAGMNSAISKPFKMPELLREIQLLSGKTIPTARAAPLSKVR